jgi:cytochrome c-type biogenesis protein CcmH/NrfF
MKRAAQVLLLCCALVLLMRADTSRFENLGGKIMCSCGCGEMLLKCNHVGCPNSEKMIRQLRAQVAKTSNDEDVLQFFREQWGVTTVVEPGRHGFELLVWVAPYAGLAAGLFLVVMIVRRWKRKAAATQPAPVKLDPHLEALRARARQETEI